MIRPSDIFRRISPLMPLSNEISFQGVSMIPQRISLLAQSIDSLRSGIANGDWTDMLPPERLLCEQLKISRSTLRRAINRIEEEGLIDKGRSGQRRRIIAKPDPSSVENGNGTRSIIWLTRDALKDIPSVNLRHIAQLQSRLASHNCMLHVARVPEKVLANPDVNMGDWLKENAADVWILHLMPEAVQNWFYQHQPVACIMGSRAPHVDLASVEVDSLAALKHAIAMLRRRGHQRIGLVRAAEHLVGEDRLEQTLRESVPDGSQVTVLNCSGEPDHMANEFGKVFAQPDQNTPTALICSISNVALFALTWLQQHGISVPRDVAMIVLRSQPVLDYASPSLAHYSIHEERMVVKVFPRLLDLLQSKACATTQINLIPEFVPGDSLGSER